MARAGGETRKRSRLPKAALVAAGALPAVVRRLDHRRPFDGVGFEEDLELEHHEVTSADGTPIHITVTGAGDRTVFMVHGWVCNEATFRFQQSFLGDSFRIVTVELRGHGKSGVPESLDYHPERLAEDLLAAVEYIDPPRFALVGFSLGGFTSMTFTRRFGSRFEGRLKGIVLLDSSGLPLTDGIIGGPLLKRLYPFPVGTFLEFAGRRGHLLDWARRLVADTSWAYLVVRFFAFGRSPQGRYVERQRETTFDTCMTTMLLGAKACMDYGVEEFLPEVAVPVLLLVGERDRLTGLKANRRTAGLLPDARLVTFPDAGHCALYERRESLNRELRDFLDEVLPEP